MSAPTKRHERILARAKELRDRARRGEAPPPPEERPEGAADEDALARTLLRPLTAWFEEDGPLHHFLFPEEQLLSLIVPERPPSHEGIALVRMWTDAAPQLTDLRYRREWRDFIVRMKKELGPDGPGDHPDLLALREAKFWIGDRLATGPASFENVLLQLLFDLSCEQGFLAGWLPEWLAEAYDFTTEGIEQEQQLRREERAMQRISYGPLSIELPPALTPTIRTAIQKLEEVELDPDVLADAAIDCASADLTPARRSETALLFRNAAGLAIEQHRPFTAFDLRAIFEALARDGAAGEQVFWLLYSRAIDARLATTSRHRRW